MSNNKVTADEKTVNLVRNILILGGHIGHKNRISRTHLGTLVRAYNPFIGDRLIRAAISQIGALSTSGGKGGYWIPGAGTAEDQITYNCIGELKSREICIGERIKRTLELRHKVITRTLVPEGVTQPSLLIMEG